MATTVYWCLLGLPLAGLAQWLFVRENFKQDIQLASEKVYPIIYLGCLIFLMQYMTMLVFSQLLVAYSLALFQLSMVLQVFLGYRIFNEPHLFQRLLACLVMVAGSIIVLHA
jgi:drug/metabolite transporter (DMT)-like permease